MSEVETTQVEDLGGLISRIRPEVRAAKAYRVAVPPETQVKLNQNENPHDLPEKLKAELAERLRAIPFNRYPDDQPAALAQALAEYTGHDAAGILVGNGSNELTHTLGLTLIAPGAPVVLPRPMFSLYESVVRLFGGRLVGVAPRADLSFDAEAIVKAVRREAPALTVLTSPNNPTGLAMPLEEIEAVVEAAEGFVVVDEAYVEFNPEPSAITLLQKHPNVLVMRTFSKAFGLAGLRLGFLLGRPAVTQELLKARVPFMVDRFAEHVALTLLERPGFLQERVEAMQASIRTITEALQKRDGVTVVPSQANFVLFKAGALSATALLERLAEEGVLVRNMGGYPELRGWLRVGAGTPDENKAFLAALEKSLSSSGAA